MNSNNVAGHRDGGTEQSPGRKQPPSHTVIIRFPGLLVLGSVLLIGAVASAQWVSVGVGIDYQSLTITMGDGKPNNLYISRMAVANTNCIINSMIASNRVAGAREKPSAMAVRSEDAINCWGQSWGQRNDVIVAINGSFEVGGAAAGLIAGGDIYDGWYADRFDDFSGQMGLIWKYDRSYFIGVCPHYSASGQTVTINGIAQTFAGINIGRTNNLIIYTPQYNNNTLTDNSGVEVLVAMSGPLKTPTSTVTGTIVQVRVNQGSTYIPFDHIVLSGAGSAATYLQNNAQVGQTVQIGQNLTLYNGPTGNLCSTIDGRNINNAYSCAQGNFNFLVSGSIIPTSNSGMIIRAPRTFLAYNSTYIYFCVCDGRTTQSVGMTSDEMGAFCVTNLLATDAVNMDGGGSSVMIVNGAIKNVPSDGVERSVVNGLMMVNLQPKIVSTSYTVGQAVTTTGAANFRLGPGTDYYAFTVLASGAQGTVVNHSVNGVYAKGYYWWKCSFNGATGWIAESLLASSTNPPSVTQNPANQLVGPGGTAQFSVAASGADPLRYRWQQNLTNLSDGGHYSGTTNATLIISAVNSNDVATYRCVVTNSYGSATSAPATLTLSTNVFGSAPLYSIPPLSGDTANEGRAITPDGRWIVGLSGSRGFLYNLSAGTAASVTSSDGALAAILTGVSYRTNGGQQELITSGLAGNLYTLWRTSDGGFTWGAKVQYSGGTPKNSTVPLANGLAGTSSNIFYGVWTDEGAGSGDDWSLFVGRGSNTWPATIAWGSKSVPKSTPSLTQLNGVAAKGRGVGWRQNFGTNITYVADWQGATTPAIWSPNGLAGSAAGQLYCVNEDGTIMFGLSPKPGGTAATNVGFKATFNTAFPGSAMQLGINALPNFPDTAGAANLAIPFGCTADGKYAVGMNYRGLEKAVLWDTSSANATNWTASDLTDLALAGGNMNVFSRLTRAYAVGTNSSGYLVITGIGLDTNSPARTRAFVMTINPAPTVSPFPVTISGSYPAGFIFSFPTVASAGRMYYLEYATNLVGTISWTTLGSTAGIGAVANLSDMSPSGAQRYYRIRVQ